MNGLNSLLKSSTSKDSAVLFTGNIISFGINFLITFLLARSFSAAQLGLFFTGLIFIQLVTDLVEAGINSALLHFIPKERNLAQRYINASFFLKLIIGLVLFLLIFALAPFIANIFLSNSDMIPYIKSSSLGIFALLFIFWGQSIFQSQQKFLLASIVNTSINVLRVLVLAFLLIFSSLGLQDIFLAFQVVLIVSVVLIVLKIKPAFKDLNFSINILKFGLPIGVSFAVAAVYTKLDQLMILKMGGELEAGIYGLAGRIVTIYIFAAAAFNNAIVPRLSSIENSQFDKYFKKALLATLVMVAMVLISVIPASLLIPVFFGSEFQRSVIPFQILALGVSFFIFSVPFSSALVYRYKKTFFPLFLSILSLILLIFLLNLFIPIYLSSGAALALLITYIVQSLISVGYFVYIRGR